MRLTLTCHHCKKVFQRILSPGNLSCGKGKFCSRDCFWLREDKTAPWNKGKKMSLAYRQKISDVQKGKKRKPLSEETKKKIADSNRKYWFPHKCIECGVIRGWYNRKRKRCKSCAMKLRFSSEIERKNISERLKNEYRTGKRTCYFKGRKLTPEQKEKIKIATRGEKHWNWKGGKETEKERRTFQQTNREIKKKGNGGEHSIEEWRALKEKFNYTCLCCGKKEPEIKLTVDHIVPIIKNGRNDIDNIQPLCQKCNSAKYMKIIDYRKIYATTL